ncbi:MAG: 30S ribosomal protein S16 [bacterium]|nr:30S ribosomal protein S16 [bacterium]
MAVRLRLKRLGRRHRPFYRVAAMDARRKRDGRVLEELGHYDPINKDAGAQLVLKQDRIDYWLGVGAQPTDTVRRLIERNRAASAPAEAPAETPTTT